MFFNLKSSHIRILGLMLLLSNLMLCTSGQLNPSRIGILQVQGNKQYFVETAAKVNFHRALQICAAMGMSLASIESPTEQQNLKNLLYTNSALSRQYWLSGNDLPASRELVWFGTGNVLTYASWASGGNTQLSQRCLRTDGNFNWRRDSCNKLYYFICEKPVLPACGFNGSCLSRPTIIY